MNIEDTNTVGKATKEMQEHIFACHEEIRHLRKLVKMHEASAEMRKCKESLYAEIDEAIATRRGVRFEPPSHKTNA